MGESRIAFGVMVDPSRSSFISPTDPFRSLSEAREHLLNLHMQNTSGIKEELALYSMHSSLQMPNEALGTSFALRDPHVLDVVAVDESISNRHCNGSAIRAALLSSFVVCI